MKLISLLLLSALILLSSCGKHLIVNYSEDAANKGKLHLLPSRSIDGVNLTVNDKLLVERQYVRKITVQNLPEGRHTYHLTCLSGGFKDKMDSRDNIQLQVGEEKTQLIEVPPMSNGYWIQSGIYTLGSWAALMTIWLVDWDRDE